jgi:hypothetical protein
MRLLGSAAERCRHGCAQVARAQEYLQGAALGPALGRTKVAEGGRQAAALLSRRLIATWHAPGPLAAGAEACARAVAAAARPDLRTCPPGPPAHPAHLPTRPTCHPAHLQATSSGTRTPAAASMWATTTRERAALLEFIAPAALAPWRRRCGRPQRCAQLPPARRRLRLMPPRLPLPRASLRRRALSPPHACLCGLAPAFAQLPVRAAPRHAQGLGGRLGAAPQAGRRAADHDVPGQRPGQVGGPATSSTGRQGPRSLALAAGPLRRRRPLLLRPRPQCYTGATTPGPAGSGAGRGWAAGPLAPPGACCGPGYGSGQGPPPNLPPPTRLLARRCQTCRHHTCRRPPGCWRADAKPADTKPAAAPPGCRRPCRDLSKGYQGPPWPLTPELYDDLLPPAGGRPRGQWPPCAASHSAALCLQPLPVPPASHPAAPLPTHPPTRLPTHSPPLAGFKRVYLEPVPRELSHPDREGYELLGRWIRQ